PAEGEPESTRGLTTRAELLRIINPDVKFTIEGTSMLRKVVDGQIIIPNQYRQMEVDDEEEEELEEEDNGKEGHEEGHGESDG
ncbi:hypothetical protein A2U01_0039912, partial [Trifolium medium]|nr:hypothetical protein [Trifolium medium]